MADDPPVKAWEIVLASFVGCCFLTIADIVFNENKAVTTKISQVVGRYAGPHLDAVWFESLAFLVLLGLGLGLCFVFRPRSRPAAFVQGSSVIGVLVSMNIGAQAVMMAQAQEVTVHGKVLYSLEEPRAFGPFGVGTLLTGRSSVTGTALTVDSDVIVTCAQQKRVGKETYCAVDGAAAQMLGVPQTGTLSNKVWIQQEMIQ